MLDPAVTDRLRRWQLVPAGDATVTAAGVLVPVSIAGRPAMLKWTSAKEERHAAAVMAWWDGEGAAAVFARDGEAMVMERAEGAASLSALARGGHDDEACRILCAVAARLHAPRSGLPPRLVPLAAWFQDLEQAAATHGGILRRAWACAAALLDAPCEIGVLHGDLHHGNVLDFGPRGWLAIDPKGLVGERTYDYAVLFANPDLADPSVTVATVPGRVARRAAVTAAAAGLDQDRLLRFVLAFAGLSASWSLGEEESTAVALTIAEAAAAALEA